MSDGALGSDHVNYLVLRYLQEAGHENAAKALYRDWNRPDEYSDPEKLPFAAVVKQYELVNIIQDGLFHDQLQATVTSQRRRFTLIDADASRRSSPEPSTREPRPQPSARPRTSLARNTDREDFPQPAAKRPRRSNGSEVHVNGDSMDIDKPQDDADNADSVSAPADTERAQSEAEPVVAEEPIETVSMGTQTEKKARTMTETMYWTLDKPESSILHTMWNPQPAMTSRLLTVGESLCRFYNLPTADGSAQHISHIDAEDMPNDSLVSAACWHPSGRYATCALEAPRPVNGSREPQHRMFDCSIRGAKRFYDLHPYVLKPAGVTLAIRYDPGGDRVLTVSTNGARGLLEVWQTQDGVKSPGPIALKFFDSVVLDAVWTSDDSILVCGDSRLEQYRISEHKGTEQHGENGSSFATAGAENMSLVYAHPTNRNWDKVRYDGRHELAAVNSSRDDCLILIQRRADIWVDVPGFATDSTHNKRATAMAFDPITVTHASSPPDSLVTPRRLAVAHDSGTAFVYNISVDGCQLLLRLNMQPHDPALALSWSPDGTQLAVASDEAVKIWDVGASSDQPVVAWQAAAAQWYQGNEHNLPGDDEGQAEPSLSWDAEGRRLGFAVGRKMAIISLLPSVQDTDVADAGDQGNQRW